MPESMLPGVMEVRRSTGKAAQSNPLATNLRLVAAAV
jgi:hypothetical protein